MRRPVVSARPISRCPQQAGPAGNAAQDLRAIDIFLPKRDAPIARPMGVRP